MSARCELRRLLVLTEEREADLIRLAERVESRNFLLRCQGRRHELLLWKAHLLAALKRISDSDEAALRMEQT